MRILFAGSPEIALPVLEVLALAPGPWELAGVLTNPDTPQGRRGAPEPTAVGRAAAALSRDKPLAILKPERLGAEAREEAAALKPDLLVSFAYGRIFGPRFLALFAQGGINIHPSLLPRYRGPAPIPAAILGRDRETGITIQRLARETDAGDILLQESFPLSGRETSGSLGERVARASPDLLRTVLENLSRGELRGIPQDHGAATYCPLITKEDGRINWTMAAADIDARIRAYTPWPLCWTRCGDRPLMILEAEPYAGPLPALSGDRRPGMVLGVDKNKGILVQTGEGLLGLTRLQYRAKKALFWRDFLNGAKNFAGSRLI
jgi:methionyl-tRNA formyltransferase